MKPQKKELEEPVEEPAEEAYNEFVYDINAKHGDVNITIVANRGSTVNVNRGQPPPSGPKPPGT